MEFKKILSVSLILVAFAFFAGCTSENTELGMEVETDVTSNNTDTQDSSETDEIEKTVDEELITDDEAVELGELI